MNSSVIARCPSAAQGRRRKASEGCSYGTSFIPASANPSCVSRTAYPHSTTSLDRHDTVQPYNHLVRRHGKGSTRFISKYFTEFIRENEQLPHILIPSQQGF